MRRRRDELDAVFTITTVISAAARRVRLVFRDE